MIQRPIEILLVEDSPADVWLTKQALEEGSVPKHISVVANGEEAIAFLRRRGAYAAVPRPDLVLLDLNLPRVDGLDVLREVKADPALRLITVIILTTSEAPVDVNAAYDLNANCYVVKPADYDQFNIMIRGIEEFWMGLASLPTSTSPSGAPPEGEGEKGGGADGGQNSKRKPSSHAKPLRFRTRARVVRRRAGVRCTIHKRRERDAL